MIKYVNLLLLLTMFGSTCYVYYRLKQIFYLKSIVMDSKILDQLTDLGRDVDSEFPKPKKGYKKKIDPKIKEMEDNDVRDKRERLVAYAKNSVTKLNDRSNSGTCDPATRNCNQTEEPSEN